jgi:hypothetical protein
LEFKGKGGRFFGKFKLDAQGIGQSLNMIGRGLEEVGRSWTWFVESLTDFIKNEQSLDKPEKP